MESVLISRFWCPVQSENKNLSQLCCNLFLFVNEQIQHARNMNLTLKSDLMIDSANCRSKFMLGTAG